MKKIIALSAFAITLTACQSVPTAPVIARADQSFETTGLGKTKIDARKDALTSAKKQCGLKTPIVLSDTTKYNGVFDEKAGRLIEQGVSVVGSVLGKATPNLSRDDDYEFTIKFKCQ